MNNKTHTLRKDFIISLSCVKLFRLVMILCGTILKFYLVRSFVRMVAYIIRFVDNFIIVIKAHEPCIIVVNCFAWSRFERKNKIDWCDLFCEFLIDPEYKNKFCLPSLYSIDCIILLCRKQWPVRVIVDNTNVNCVNKIIIIKKYLLGYFRGYWLRNFLRKQPIYPKILFFFLCIFNLTCGQYSLRKQSYPAQSQRLYPLLTFVIIIKKK